MGFYCNCGMFFPTNNLEAYLNKDGETPREMERGNRRLHQWFKDRAKGRRRWLAGRGSSKRGLRC